MAVNRTALRRSLGDGVAIDQNMLRYVLDQSRDCIKILSPEGIIEYINDEGRCALEVADCSAVCGRYWPDLWPEASRQVVEAAVQDAISGKGSMFEAWRLDGEAQSRCWRISVSPLLEADGELAGILTISRDITSDAMLRETERMLALEMRHRLRNAYTIASAIVMQSAGNDKPARVFAETVCARLADVAISQTKLLEAGEKAWLLSDLIRTLVEAHGEGANSIRYTGSADARVEAAEALLIALVVGELTNNSLKYGALRRGEALKLIWSDDGKGLAIRWREVMASSQAGTLEPRSDGSGYVLMKRMAAGQGATFAHDVVDGELVVDLVLRKRAI